MAILAEAVAAALIVLGAFFLFVGSFGLARLPDTMRRLHAPTKATTLGIGCTLIASMVWFAGVAGRVRSVSVRLSVSLLSVCLSLCMSVSLSSCLLRPLPRCLSVLALSVKRGKMRFALGSHSFEMSGTNTTHAHTHTRIHTHTHIRTLAANRVAEAMPFMVPLSTVCLGAL